ncbi:MAG: hypothetical protein LBU83_10565 [Bacteroidales bacterium]|jgi:hypothetical protein|nr:hypothetical protein [Bacteroidales bacterium]
MKNKLLLLFLFLPFISFSQEDILLKGNVFDGVSFFPIAEANIYNFNIKKYSFTDKEGNFDILTHLGDTIIISKSIYKPILIKITEEIIKKGIIEIPLYFKVIVLKEVSVYALPSTYEGFKKDFINIVFTDIFKKIENTNLTQLDLINAEYKARGGPNILRNTGFANPISWLYDRFSKKKKMERLYQELVENQNDVDNLHLKYNREIVTSLTGLEGEELLDFMTFCKFSYYDLVRWEPEFIISKIKTRFNDYEFYKALEDY